MAATRVLHLVVFLSLLFLALLQSQMAASQSSSPSTLSFDIDEEGDEEYVLDSPFANTHLRSRFLASIKKGKKCNAEKKNICNGVWANKGKYLLYCCKKHCRDVLRDENNCGGCGNKCLQGQKCCGGGCVNVRNNPQNCGKCGRQCANGQMCGQGFCGYA